MGIDEYAVEDDQIDLLFLLFISLKIEIFKQYQMYICNQNITS